MKYCLLQVLKLLSITKVSSKNIISMNSEFQFECIFDYYNRKIACKLQLLQINDYLDIFNFNIKKT